MVGTVQNNGGGRFIEYGVTEEPQGTDFICPSHIVDDPAVRSMIAGFNVSQKDGTTNECSSSSRKRNRVESSAEPGTKACREKMRRDKLNDRFHELASSLDPSRPPISDKVDILNDATCRLNQLRLEVQTLKKSNDELQENTKNVKVEKVEVRDEKVRLKAEKERLEQILKAMITPTPFIPHPTVSAAYHHPTFATFSKTVPYSNNSPVATWQWISPALLDTSRDLVLRPAAA